MYDPKYWRDREPEIIRKVSAAFNDLFDTKQEPTPIGVEALKREVRGADLGDKGECYSDDVIDHLASAGYLRAPLPRIEWLDISVKNPVIDIDPDIAEWVIYCGQKEQAEAIIKAARAYQKASEV